MSHRTVNIFGSGPAGILAAHAALDSGAAVRICSLNSEKPRATEAGVFVLHKSCNLPLESAEFQHICLGGKATDYRRKVYGERCDSVVDFKTSFGWEGRQVYYNGEQALNMAWDIVQPSVSWTLGEFDFAQMLHLVDKGEYVVNTIPLPVIFPLSNWPFREAWVKASKAPTGEAYILQHANENVPWYRVSAGFGRFTYETTQFQPSKEFRAVKKVMPAPQAPPIHPRILYTGRFGAWDKTKLSHHAYYDTLEFLGRRWE